MAGVAWLSEAFIDEFDFGTPFPKAPELCIEIVSPSNSKIEIQDKIDLYLAKGTLEVWVVYELNRINMYSCMGQIDGSKVANISKAQNPLDYLPNHQVAEGITGTLDWYVNDLKIKLT